MGIVGSHDNLDVEGYDFVRENWVEGEIFVYNRESEGYEKWVEAPHYSGFTLIHEDKQYEFVSSVSYTVAKGQCDSCCVATINGTVCHERGCPRTQEETR